MEARYFKAFHGAECQIRLDDLMIAALPTRQPQLQLKINRGGQATYYGLGQFVGYGETFMHLPMLLAIKIYLTYDYFAGGYLHD